MVADLWDRGAFQKEGVSRLFDSYLSEPTPQIDTAGPDSLTAAVAATDASSSSDSDSTSSSSQKRKRTETVCTRRSKKPRSESERKERRRMQNRMAAATSREKKKRYHQELEHKVQSLSTQNTDLQRQIEALLEENNRLKSFHSTSSFESPTLSSTPTELKSNAQDNQKKANCTSTIDAITPNESAVLCIPQQPEVMVTLVSCQVDILVQLMFLPLILLQGLSLMSTNSKNFWHLLKLLKRSSRFSPASSSFKRTALSARHLATFSTQQQLQSLKRAWTKLPHGIPPSQVRLICLVPPSPTTSSGVCRCSKPTSPDSPKCKVCVVTG